MAGVERDELIFPSPRLTDQERMGCAVIEWDIQVISGRDGLDTSNGLYGWREGRWSREQGRARRGNLELTLS